MATLKRKTIVIDGVRISYLEKEANAPSAIFLHGFASGSYVWNGLLKEMNGAFRIIMPDLPGHGLSGLPGPEPTLEYHVQLVEQLRIALNIDRFHAVGHSMGACILASYSVVHSERLIQLIMESPPDDRSRLPLFWKIITIPILGDFLMCTYPPTRRILRRRMERGFHDSSVLTEEMLDEAWIAFSKGPVRKWIPRALRVAPSPVPWEKITLPCKIVYGVQDRLVKPAFLDRLRGAIGRAEFHAFDNCRHVPHLEHPQKFAGLINFGF